MTESMAAPPRRIFGRRPTFLFRLQESFCQAFHIVSTNRTNNRLSQPVRPLCKRISLIPVSDASSCTWHVPITIITTIGTGVAFAAKSAAGGYQLSDRRVPVNPRSIFQQLPELSDRLFKLLCVCHLVAFLWRSLRWLRLFLNSFEQTPDFMCQIVVRLVVVSKSTAAL